MTLDDVEALLRDGRYREGFTAYEARRPRLTSPPTRGNPPEWMGQSLAGKHILVWGEQGLGDEIQMVRFLRDLRRLGAARVLLACNRPLMRLFTAAGADVVYNRRAEQLVVEHYDYWVMAMSLPLRLGLSVDAVSGSAYLPRPQATHRGGVGLVWRGNPGHRHDRYRSLPSPDLLSSLPGGVFLEPVGDFLDSARQLAALDALVTVDTSWAHLAGAIGVPTAVLLHRNVVDWRWGATGDRSPWYDSVRLFRQPETGNWGSAITAAREWLTKSAGSG